MVVTAKLASLQVHQDYTPPKPCFTVTVQCTVQNINSFLLQVTIYIYVHIFPLALSYSIWIIYTSSILLINLIN